MEENPDSPQFLVAQGRELSPTFEAALAAGGYSFTAAPAAYLPDNATRYGWPGNLRELENLVKRYVILGDAEETFRELLDLARFEHPLAIDESAAGDQNLKIFHLDGGPGARAQAAAARELPDKGGHE